MNIAKKFLTYVALGSNLNNPIAQIKKAIEELHFLPHTQFIAASSLYSSPPLGPQEQPDFINAVVKLITRLTAEELLLELQMLEQAHGRVRDEANRWGPRTLDLDLILYGDETIHTEKLTVPHPELKKRAFVLVPLAEIAPDLVLPDGVKLKSLQFDNALFAILTKFGDLM